MFGLPDPLDPESQIGFLVDLPGYGYASVAHRAREEWADILGGYATPEGSGLRHLTRQTCDWMVRLPQLGTVESLNVSVASGVCLYEALRQRG